MDPENLLIRIAYSMLFLALALMTWAYTVGASSMVEASPRISSRSFWGGTSGAGSIREIYRPSAFDEPSPCSFNPLCTCSTSGPVGFGDVNCDGIPFGTIPKGLNSSRAHTLSMTGNDLTVFGNRNLVGSGLVSIRIRDNNLYHIDDYALDGLSRTLVELDLEDNELTEIPIVPLRHLQQLQILNLNRNKITDIHREDFSGWKASNSMVCLSLRGNMIVSIPEDAFVSLSGLEILDLSGNSIQIIDSRGFSARSLNYLSLSDNLLSRIPFESLQSLNLDHLDLSHNLITSTFDIIFSGKLSIDELDLSYNQIHSLPALSFQNFRKAEKVNLAYNPINEVEDNAFRNSKIDELDLSHCYIHEIDQGSFKGLEKDLQVLDLSFNNISNIHPQLLENFDYLTELNLDENPLKISPDEFDGIIRYTLRDLSILGNLNLPISLEDIRIMRNLERLNITNFGATVLNSNVFEGFSQAVEHLKISQSKITSIDGMAFTFLRGMKTLDLSDNKISRIDNNAFQNIGSLLSIKLNNAVKMGSIPPQVLEKLKDVRELDLSSNGLSSLPEESFLKNDKLMYLNLRFNKIALIGRSVFDASRVPRLERLYLSFNKITEIKEATFSRLKQLEYIELNENMITSIRPHAFIDLPNLKVLNLGGNKISTLADESFQKIPRFQKLDLSYNDLTSINFDAFELLGTISSFRINFSHNKIQKLATEAIDIGNPSHPREELGYLDHSSDHHSLHADISTCSVQSLNLSNNNISYISPYFFAPVGSTIIDLDLSHNSLLNLTKEHLSGMSMIEKIGVSHNDIGSLGYDTFTESNSVQVIDLSHNELKDIPKILFEGCTNLRVLDVSNNKIRNLHESLFGKTRLEIFDIHNNFLGNFPDSSLSKVANTLVNLNLANNWISSLSATQFECLYNLRWVNIANNHIDIIADSAFDDLKNLLYLDLTGNPLTSLSTRMFHHIRDSLLELHVSNMSLDILPDFDEFPHLLNFNASFNNLSSLPTNFGTNISSLRTLDISANNINTLPSDIWDNMPRLSELRINSNPLKTLANDSFINLDHLLTLDMSDLPLESMQMGLFYPLGCLEKLKIGPLPQIIDLGPFIVEAESLQHLQLELDVPTMTTELSELHLPEKLSTIELSGKNLKSIAPGALQEVSTRDVKLIISDTGLSELSAAVLHDLGFGTNLHLEISGNNSALRKIANPSQKYRPKPFSTYLNGLYLDNSMRITCSCDSGWIEFWLRQWMDKTCPTGSKTPKEDGKECGAMLRSLRNVECMNKPDTQLSEAFVNELECGWESSSASIPENNDLLIILISVAVYIRYI